MTPPPRPVGPRPPIVPLLQGVPRGFRPGWGDGRDVSARSRTAADGLTGHPSRPRSSGIALLRPDPGVTLDNGARCGPAATRVRPRVALDCGRLDAVMPPTPRLAPTTATAFGADAPSAPRGPAVVFEHPTPDRPPQLRGALRRLDAWLDGPLQDPNLAAYVAELHAQGESPSSAASVASLASQEVAG